MKLSHLLCVLTALVPLLTLWRVRPVKKQQQPPLVLDGYDVLVVGAGLSGAVLAERHVSLGMPIASAVAACALAVAELWM